MYAFILSSIPSTRNPTHRFPSGTLLVNIRLTRRPPPPQIRPCKTLPCRNQSSQNPPSTSNPSKTAKTSSSKISQPFPSAKFLLATTILPPMTRWLPFHVRTPLLFPRTGLLMRMDRKRWIGIGWFDDECLGGEDSTGCHVQDCDEAISHSWDLYNAQGKGRNIDL